MKIFKAMYSAGSAFAKSRVAALIIGGLVAYQATTYMARQDPSRVLENMPQEKLESILANMDPAQKTKLAMTAVTIVKENPAAIQAVAQYVFENDVLDQKSYARVAELGYQKLDTDAQDTFLTNRVSELSAKRKLIITGKVTKQEAIELKDDIADSILGRATKRQLENPGLGWFD